MSCISSSLVTGRTFYPEHAKGDGCYKKRYPDTPVWGLGLRFKLYIVKFLNVENLRTTAEGRKRGVILEEAKFYDGLYDRQKKYTKKKKSHFYSTSPYNIPLKIQETHDGWKPNVT